ncbi:MAG: PAS domain-containing protein [Burkholderiales bacterium]|nr:PAS domain-containing protein [Burkholderiales bacterium]
MARLWPGLEVLTLPAAFIDQREIYALANDAFCQWMGVSRETLLGRTVREMVGAQMYARIRPHIRAALAGDADNYERQDFLPDGSERWAKVNFSPVTSGDGQVLGYVALIQDIKDVKELERAAKRREEQLQLITDNVGMPIGYIDRDFIFRFSNRPGQLGLGLTEMDMVGRHVSDIFGADVFAEVKPRIEQAFGGEKVVYERHAMHHGGRRWIRTTLLPDIREDGSVTGVYTVVADIDQDHQLRHALQQKEAQLRLITDNIGAPITYIDRSLRFQFVNKPGEIWAGRPASEIVGALLVDVLGADNLAAIMPFLERAFAGEPVIYERQATWVKGEARWIRNHLFPDRQPDGTVAGIYTLLTDVSEDHRLRDALAQREADMRRFADRIPVAIAYLDPDARYTFVNAAFETARGVSRDQVLGKTTAEVLGPEAAEHNRPYRERALGGEVVNFERFVQLASGEGRWYRIQQAPDHDESGGIRGIYVIAIDIHERKLAELALKESEAELRNTMESVPYPLAYIDADLRYGQANSAYEHYTGFSPAELLGKRLKDLFEPERFKSALPNLDRVLSGETFDVERLIPGVLGRPDRWLRIRYTPRFNNNGAVIGFYSAGVDIDDLKRAELELRHANSMLVSHFENTPLAVVEWGRDGSLLRWSPQAEKMFGWTFDELQDVEWHDWDMVYEEDLAHVREIYSRMLSGQQRRVTSLNRNRRKDGRVIWCEWYNSSLLDESGQVLSVLSLGQDVTARVLAEERLQHLATHDVLTGLPNRVLLLDRLRQAIARARRSGLRVCTLFIDLDRFKEVNDTLGHRIGDELLREMSVRLARVVRESDLLVRLSGDEFMVVLEQVNDLDAPRMVAQKLLDEIREPSHIEGHEIYISASVGLSLFPDDGDDAETLMRNADLAMYRAKGLGKNTFQMFTADMAAQGAEMRLLENALRSAIARQELELHYQPLFELASGKLIGAESLLRWHHPVRGMLAPGAFIHLAEESGLIHEIGNWVLDAALGQLRAWHDGGANIRMAVNLSAGQFRAAHFTERIREKLRRAGCPAHLIELEVTETSLLQDAEVAGRMLAELRGMGVRVAIDDFGTGYSSLSHLKRFPIDTLKVDRSFVTDILEDADDAAIVSAVIALGQALQLEVTAEGVEHAAQRDWLAARGCHAVQGYLTGRPVSAAEFEALYLGSISTVSRGI